MYLRAAPGRSCFLGRCCLGTHRTITVSRSSLSYSVSIPAPDRAIAARARVCPCRGSHSVHTLLRRVTLPFLSRVIVPFDTHACKCAPPISSAFRDTAAISISITGCHPFPRYPFGSHGLAKRLHAVSNLPKSVHGPILVSTRHTYAYNSPPCRSVPFSELVGVKKSLIASKAVPPLCLSSSTTFAAGARVIVA